MLRRTKNEVRRRRAALALLAGRPRGRVLDAPGDGNVIVPGTKAA